MWVLAATIVRFATRPGAGPPARPQPPPLDAVMLLGFVAAFATVVCYLHRRRSRSVLLAMAVCLAAVAAYGFLQGAWPLGLLEAFWCGATMHQWRESGRFVHTRRGSRHREISSWSNLSAKESHISRMFGPS